MDWLEEKSKPLWDEAMQCHPLRIETQDAPEKNKGEALCLHQSQAFRRWAVIAPFVGSGPSFIRAMVGWAAYPGWLPTLSQQGPTPESLPLPAAASRPAPAGLQRSHTQINNRPMHRISAGRPTESDSEQPHPAAANSIPAGLSATNCLLCTGFPFPCKHACRIGFGRLQLPKTAWA